VFSVSAAVVLGLAVVVVVVVAAVVFLIEA